MSSVEGSDRGEDSLSQEQQLVLKNNKIARSKHNSRGSRNSNSEDALYNEALKQYMFGRFDIASQSCKKMIANNPENPEPYFLMATMYQQAANRNNDQTQLYKSVQYFFFHAYYSAPSVQKWMKVAEMSYQLQLYQQAAYCYGRALKMHKTDLQISMKRAECLQMCLQIKKATNIYKRIIQKISNSAEVYKRYAKLRFRREQFAKARQILFSYPLLQQDLNIKYMIAQTYLKQKKYKQLYQFIFKNIIEKAKPPIVNIYKQLQTQFIQMLFICRINCPDGTPNELKIPEMLQFLKSIYDQQDSSLYQQIVQYIKKQNPEITYQLLSFLLKFQPHQSIQNYLYSSQYLVKCGRCQQAIKILQNGLAVQKNKRSVQLKTQLNYLKILLKNKSKNQNKVPIYKNKNVKIKQQIYYSDQQQQGQKKQQLYSDSHLHYSNDKFAKKQQEQSSIFKDQQSFEENHQNSKKKNKKIVKKNKKIRSQQVRTSIQVKDPDTVCKLIENNYLTLQTLKSQLQNAKQGDNSQNLVHTIKKTHKQLKQCLSYIVQVQSIRQQNPRTNLQLLRNQSIFNNRQPKKRRMILGSRNRRQNLISQNSQTLLKSVKCILYFLKEYLRVEKYAQVIQFAQLLSKAHFFKWQNRIGQFKALKVQVYQMGVLACLQLHQYGKSIFFLRYLINKNPLNQFYLAIAQKIMRLSTGKIFINKLIKNDLESNQSNTQIRSSSVSQKDFVKVYYLAGIQYMENCFFQLALNMFTRVVKILESYQSSDLGIKEMCKTTYMCMATCFLQLASSRTVFNKLDHVNRSAFCLAKYKSFCSQQQQQQITYNQARWYNYVKLYPKAIQQYEKILQNNKNIQLVKRSAINLIIIYKDLEQYEKVKQLVQKYLNQVQKQQLQKL